MKHLLLSLLLVSHPIAAKAQPHSGSDAEGISQPEPVWRLSGNRALWPERIYDDGMKTYILWHSSQPIPAVFALDRSGREEMVNGYMRGSIFTIDAVVEQLLFRVDRVKAKAWRKLGRPGR